MKSLRFRPMPEHKRGTILKMLQQSYYCLPQIDAHVLGQWELDWRTYDDDIFNHPDTIGASGFVTYQGKTIIGFASWDPRKHPIAIVGHNCILPEFRGRGYGKQQLKELLCRLRSLGFTKARTTTGDHPGFLAAQRMYLACGFRITRSFSNHTAANWKIMELEKDL